MKSTSTDERIEEMRDLAKDLFLKSQEAITQEWASGKSGAAQLDKLQRGAMAGAINLAKGFMEKLDDELPYGEDIDPEIVQADQSTDQAVEIAGDQTPPPPVQPDPPSYPASPAPMPAKKVAFKKKDQ